jgi:hypothetical protein
MARQLTSWRIKFPVVSGLLALGLVSYATYVFAHASGMTGVTQKNGNGCTCHGTSPSSAVTVVINGPAELATGQTGNYTVTVQGGPAVRAGVDIAASAGVLNVTSSVLQKEGDELTHTSPQPFSGGTATFSFSYTAPSTAGTITLFANGNSVNLNGSTSGDQWNFAPNKTVTVKTATAVEGSSTLPQTFTLSQNYPNPFNPSTTIKFALPEAAQVKVEVYNVLGARVATLVDEVRPAGYHLVRFEPANLPTGMYVYRLAAAKFVATRPMMFVK